MANVTIAKAAFEKMVGGLSHQRIVSYTDVFSSTVLIYEIIINLHVEIEHIWMRKWSPFSVLYLLQRYLPLLDSAVLVLHRNFGQGLSPRYCTLNYKITTWSFFVGVVLSEIILTLRVWAIWGRTTPVALGLLGFFLACWVPCYIVLRNFLRTLEFTTVPFAHFHGCYSGGGSDILYLCWVLLMLYDTGTFVMILVPGISAYRRGGRLELIKTIYQDGVIYFGLLFVIFMINVVIILALPPDLMLLLASFGRVLHSLLTSRAILHIREVAGQRSTYQTMSQF